MMPAVDVNELTAPEARPYHVLVTGFGVSCHKAFLVLTFSNSCLTVREHSHSIASRLIHHGWP